MQEMDVDYVLFDSEIILTGNQFGGKYGALNYLGCAYLNETDVSKSPGQSECEQNNFWEEVYIPTSPNLLQMCTISYEKDVQGTVAYYGNIVAVQDAQGQREYRVQLAKDVYCISPEGITYFLDKKDDEGDLIIHGGVLNPAGKIQSVQGDEYLKVSVLYMDENYTIGNTTINNWENRVGNFYDSNLYKAFMLDHLDGFEKVYDNGNVKIFKKG